MKLFLFALKHLHIHIYMTNNGNMKYGKVNKSWFYIYDLPILTSIYYGSIKSLYLSMNIFKQCK